MVKANGKQVADEVERPAGVAEPVGRPRVADSETEKTSTVAAPSTSARSSALRRSSGGRVWMSHAWLIAWRSAPITPLAATISSRTEIGPEPAGVVERVVDRALQPRAVGVLR